MNKAAAIRIQDDTKGPGAWIAGRYQVQEQLGKGGMGAVYRVVDESTGRTLALKQLIREPTRPGSQTLVLFQREYHTLVQLAHPLIIEVYDYGVDEGKPYYTMELLGGSDLRAMAPMDWKRACGLLRDVAFSLALVHSRRLIHRDVTPRNVRCTENGRAKLIDFGAMVPMGPVKRVVGTPPFVPPEALNHQPLDDRADLFSLGALAYWVLTGRHAYPARNMEHLMDVWRSKPVNPSVFASDIPPALDRLVMSLLSLDRLARPVNAAEVIDRLNAIADLPEDESVAVSQAYLSTPNLVGRARQVTKCRKHILRGVRSNGATLVITGASGMGRSRLLMACMLDAKIAGATVLSATSEDASKGDYGVVNALVDDLLEALPSPTLEVARDYEGILGHVLPRLHSQLGCPELACVDDPDHLRPQVQSAVRELFTAVAAEYRLLVTVDDFHMCDEPSAAVLAALGRLSRDARNPPLVLAVTAESGAEVGAVSRAIRMLEAAGTRVVLRGLSREEAEELVGLVFGNVPNVSVLADWVYGLSQGNPRTCMELAQHVVDHGIARYQGGQWVLPDSLRGQPLPESVEQALDACIENLSPSARALAETLSLATHHTGHRLKDCVELMQEVDQREVFAALNDLVASQVLVRKGDAYGFRQAGLVQALHRRLSEERRREIHASLAKHCQSQGHDDPWILIHHLQEAGQAERALELLLPLVEKVGAAVGAHALQVQCCETGLALAEEMGRSPREIYFIRKTLLHLANRCDAALLRHADRAEEQLCEDSGLVFWDQLKGLQADQRAERCLQMAQVKWESSPEERRGLNPIEAIQELAVYAVLVSGAGARAMDIRRIARLPGLVAPLRTLAPSIDLLALILEASHGAFCGRWTGPKNQAIENSLGQPLPGMTDALREQTRHLMSYYQALDAIDQGDMASAMARARGFEGHPIFAAHAWQVRMLAHLRTGDVEEAESCRERFDLLAMQNPGSEGHLVGGLINEAESYMYSGDLMALKRVLVSLRQLAERFPGWAPFLHGVRGEYHRLRGQLRRARTDLQKAADLAAPGAHMAWWRVMPSMVQTLVDLGEFQRARDLALDALEQCRRHELHFVGSRNFKRVLALAEAKLGQHSQAAARVHELIAEAESQHLSPLWLGYLYETRARVALDAQDEDAFAQFAQLTAEQYRPRRNPALIARYEKLMTEAACFDVSLDDQIKAAMLTVEGTTSTAKTTETLLPD